MKSIKVAAAIICDSLTRPARILAVQRGYGESKGMWEFPGGKLEAGESAQQALIREIREELSAEISVGIFAGRVEYDYPTFHLSMDCYWAEVYAGELALLEASASAWLTADTLDTVDWLPADRIILPHVLHVLQSGRDCSNGAN